MDIVAIKGMRFDDRKGLFAIEKKIKQEFIVDLWLGVSLEGKSRLELKDSIDYTEVYDLVCMEMKKDENLLEQLAKNIQSCLYQHFPLLKHCRVRISKFPQLKGPIDHVYIELN